MLNNSYYFQLSRAVCVVATHTTIIQVVNYTTVFKTISSSSCISCTVVMYNQMQNASQCLAENVASLRLTLKRSACMSDLHTTENNGM